MSVITPLSHYFPLVSDRWFGEGTGERLGEAPIYCSRRDAANGMPVMALVLIFVSPHSPLGVRVFYASYSAALFPCLSSREICHQRKYVIKRYVIKENMSFCHSVLFLKEYVFVHSVFKTFDFFCLFCLLIIIFVSVL